MAIPATEEKAVTPESQPTQNAAPTVDAPEGPTKFIFRECEHKGEAELEEIEAGFDDGEITLNCEIHDVAADTWIPIESFLEEQNGNTKLQLPIPPVDMDADDGESSRESCVTSSSRAETDSSRKTACFG